MELDRMSAVQREVVKMKNAARRHVSRDVSGCSRLVSIFVLDQRGKALYFICVSCWTLLSLNQLTLWTHNLKADKMKGYQKVFTTERLLIKFIPRNEYKTRSDARPMSTRHQSMFSQVSSTMPFPVPRMQTSLSVYVVQMRVLVGFSKLISEKKRK